MSVTYSSITFRQTILLSLELTTNIFQSCVRLLQQILILNIFLPSKPHQFLAYSRQSVKVYGIHEKKNQSGSVGMTEQSLCTWKTVVLPTQII